MLSNNLERTLKKALSIAEQYRHEYATYEHLLLALTDDLDVRKAFVVINVDAEQLKSKLTKYIKEELEDLVDEDFEDTKPTAGFQRVIQRAALHNQAKGRRVVNGLHILAEFFFEQETNAFLYLRDANLSQGDLSEYINKFDTENDDQKQLGSPSIIGTSMIVSPRDMQNEVQSEVELETTVTTNEKKEEDELEKYCVNLNERANANSIDCLVGRQNEIQRTIEILCRRKKNNAILVGEPGVGKTAIAEGLATRIVKKDVPDLLKDTVIFSLDIGSLVSGTKFRGDFEERIKNLLAILKENKNYVLFIDEIHTIIGAGSTTSGALDASNLLKPALAKGDIRCIGSTTFKEYTNHFEKDAALVRRFQKVVVSEPTEESSLEILKGLKGYYEKHHNVKYTDDALKAAINLSERYIHDRNLPDKAIDLIDEAGARSKMHKSGKEATTITEEHIEELLSSILNIPKINAEDDEIAQLKTLNKELQKQIFGQDAAIDSLCASIKLSRAGLKKGSRPTGCYLFAGPTGVGKTELAKQLALILNMKLLKFDMSEYAEVSSLSKLLGSAPGYVGYDQGGVLSSEVDKYPYSVVLFDEIEKAHPDIFNILLQIMDEGVLTDSAGKQINFSHTMIILTTNLTSRETKAAIGFSDQEEETKQSAAHMDVLAEALSPEFRSRLDNIIVFNPIDGIIDKIVEKNIKELAAQLADKKVRLVVSGAMKEYLRESYFIAKNGAREISRTIDSKIKQAIADEILFGKLKSGGVAKVDFVKKTEKVTFEFSGAKKLEIGEVEAG
jgi:ATP-dependent Clp protease ATP-binding subunit ClpA